MKAKKTILFNVSGHGHLLPDRIGGVEKVVLEAVKALKNDYNIVLFGDFPWTPKGVTVIPFYGRMGGSIKHAVNIVSYLGVGLRKIKTINSDLIISTHQRNQLLSYFYARSKKVPFISWELDHDPWVEPMTPIKKLYHYFARKPVLTLSMSEEQRQRIIRSGRPGNTIKVLYQGIDTAYYCPARSKKIIGNDYVLYVAKFLPRKNQLNLLKAFKLMLKQHPALKLVLVGPKSGGYTGSRTRVTSYYEECKAYIVENLKGRVVHYEDITEDALVKLYQQALVYCMPSTEEGFGMTLLEAMSCGCACVVNNVAPMTEVIGSAGVLVEATRPSHIAAALRKIIGDSKLRLNLRQSARKRALKMFSITAFSNSLKKNIDAVLQRTVV